MTSSIPVFEAAIWVSRNETYKKIK